VDASATGGDAAAGAVRLARGSLHVIFVNDAWHCTCPSQPQVTRGPTGAGEGV
jgi:hypothetical protein